MSFIRTLCLLISLLLPGIWNGAVAQENTNQSFLSQVGVTDSLYSQILDEPREIYVQLPVNYDPAGTQKYPVAYILDGEVLLPALKTVHDFYSGGFMPEMVLVGVSNAKNRVRDLTTSRIDTKYGMPFREENGSASTFIQFIEEELIPFVESTYPVTGYRTLIGHSYGGLFTIYALLNHPGLFANYLAIDPSLDWDDQQLLKVAPELMAQHDYQGKALFITLSGQLHMQDASVTIDNVMEDDSDFTLFARSNLSFAHMIREEAQNGLWFDWKFYPNDLHGTIALPSIMDGMIALFEWFQMEHTDQINNFETPTEALADIIRYRADKLEKHFGYPEPPYPEELLNMLGYMNMDMQQPAKAKMVFEMAIEYFPESANTYDAMADYYEAQEDPVNTLKYVTKAYELSGSTYHKERLEKLKQKK